MSTPPLAHRCVSAATAVTLAVGLMPTAAFAEAGECASDAAQQQPGIEVAADDQQQENGAENTGTDKDSNGENGSTSDTEKAEGDANKGAAEDSESQPKSTQQPAEQAAGSEAANAIAAYAATGALTYHSGDLKNNTLWDAVHNAMGKKTTSRYRLTHKATGIQKVIYYDILNPTIDDLASGEYKVEYSSLGNYKECGTFTLQKQFNISNITVNGCETGGLQVNGTDITAPYAVDEGADFSFTVKPVEDFKVESVTVDNTPIQPDASGVYTIANMSSDKSIVATYKADNEATLIATFDNATVKAYGTDLTSGAPQTVTAKQDGNAVIEPAEGYAVASVKLDGTELIGNATFGTYTATVSLGKLEKDSMHTLTVETAKSELVTKSEEPAVGIVGLDKSEYAQRVFRDVVDVNKTVPAGLTASEVTIKYNAGGIFNPWKNLDYDPGYDIAKHAFGSQKNETIRISYAGNAQYPGWEQELSVSFADTRFETKIFMNSSCSLYYNADEATMEENLFNLLQPSVQGEDGKLITGLTKDDFEFSGLEQKIGEQTVTVKYKGNKEYKGCEATAKVTVVKGKSSLSVSSKSIDFGTTVGINDLVSTTPSNAETKPITVIAGIDGSASGFVGIDFGDVTINDIAGKDIPFGSKSLQNWITGIIGNEFTVSDLDSKIDTIATALEALGVPESSNIVSALRSISTMLNSIPGLGNATIRIGAAPSNAGVYLVGAATASANYETSVGMGYLTIARSETKAVLEFRKKIGTNVHLKVSEAEKMDYSVDATIDKEPAGNKVDLLVTFAGTTEDGKAYLKTAAVKGDSQNKLQDIAPKVPGLYTQTAFCIGNYPASPISRIYTINKAETTLVVNDVAETYDGTPKPATATVLDEDDKEVKDANVEITYSGTSLNGNTYDHAAEAPSEAGSYTINATYAGTDEYTAATAAATLTINPAEATLGLANTEQTYDGSAKQVTVTGTENLPESGISVTYNGGTDLPTEAGTYTVEATFDPSNRNYDVTSAEGTLVIKPAEASITLGGTGSFTYDGNAKTAAATLPAGVPGKATLSYSGTLHDGTTYGPTNTAPTEAGEYVVTATYEGSPNYRIADATGTIVISQAATKVALLPLADTIYDGTAKEATAEVRDENGNPIQGVSAKLKYNDSDELPVSVGTYTVEAVFEGTNNYAPSESEMALFAILPALTVTTEGNGTAAAFDESGQPGKGGAAGTELKLSAAPEDGYEFAGWTVESGDAVVANAKAANTTLTMGEKSSTVKATFVKKDAPTPPVDPADPTDPSNPESPAADNGNNQASGDQANNEQAKSAVQTSDNSLAPIALGFAGTATAVALAALIMMMRRRRS